MNKFLWYLGVFLFFCLELMDVLSTQYLIDVNGVRVERQPIGNALYALYGWQGLAIVKLSAFLGIVVFLYILHRMGKQRLAAWLLVTCIAVMSLVVGVNLITAAT